MGMLVNGVWFDDDLAGGRLTGCEDLPQVPGGGDRQKRGEQGDEALGERKRVSEHVRAPGAIGGLLDVKAQLCSAVKVQRRRVGDSENRSVPFFEMRISPMLGDK